MIVVPAYLVIIIGLAFPFEIRIGYPDLDACYVGMDNFYFSYYREVHSGLTLPNVRISCEEMG